MDGGEERGVFVLSRELHNQLPQHFINNSAHVQGSGVGGQELWGDSSTGDHGRWRPEGNPGALPAAVT